MVRVKVCGLTNLEDARAAAHFGADALGFVFAKSPRQVSPEQARAIIKELPILTAKVGVFVDEPPEQILGIAEYCGLDYIQLHLGKGAEELAHLGQKLIVGLRVADSAPDETTHPSCSLLLDTYSKEAAGGTGKSFDWSLAKAIAAKRDIILAGGLGPENVVQAIETARPFGVDASSGLEASAGRKDHERVSEFIARAKSLG